MTAPNESSLPQRLAELETRLQELERSGPADVWPEVRAMIQTVLDFHGAGLARLLELIDTAGESGRTILDRAGQDDLVGSVLLLHGLHPVTLEGRLRGALEQVRPFLQSQGADVDLLGVIDDTVRLHLRQADQGFAASGLTLRAALEETIWSRCPDIHGIAFVEPTVVRFPLPLVGQRS
ncbi:MAG: NifU family protein [Gemmataceae bacterium]|nr:NifU family protein [Gemmataceae bacterium]